MIFSVITRMTRAQKHLIFAAVDSVTIPVSFVLAMILVAPEQMPRMLAPEFALLMGALLVFGTLTNLWLGLPLIKLNAFELSSAMRSGGLGIALGAMGVLLGNQLMPGLPAGLYAVFALLFTVLVVSGRVVMRALTVMVYRKARPSVRIVIYGAGRTGQQFAAALRQDETIRAVAFVDDNPTMQGMSVAGLSVSAPSAIHRLIAQGAADRVVLAMPSISPPALARIANRLRTIGCEVQALPSFAQLVGEDEVGRRTATIPLDELLGRTGLEADLPGVREAFRAQRVMITGAGGSIGSELSRQVAACKPERIVLVDHSELALYNIEKELLALGVTAPVVPVLGSVLDAATMRDAIENNRVETVLHAAAYKHLPMVECNPLSGLRNNVLGTKVLADVARDCAVKRFVLVSSDKAVRPTNVMGASKRLAELVIQDLATRSEATRFSMVRFGNVLGSSGSVVPVFEEQIARGGPLTLTHTDVTRYFMTIPEAVRLVLLACGFARGGDVFVLDMGTPVPIARLARQMIEGAGYSVRDADNPDGDIEIAVTGLRAGEKLHEELLIAPDMLTTPHPKILRAQENGLSEFEMATALRELRDAIEDNDEDAARDVIRRWVEHDDPVATAAQGS